MPIIFEDEDLNVSKKDDEGKYEGWSVDDLKDEVESATEDSDEFKFDNEDTNDIVDEEFDPDFMFTFNEEEDPTPDDDEDSDKKNSKKDDEEPDGDDENQDEDEPDDDSDSKDDDKNENKSDSKKDDEEDSKDSKSISEAFMMFEDDDSGIMDQDDIDGPRDMSPDDAPKSGEMVIDDFKDEVESATECGSSCSSSKGMKTTHEGENGKDGIPDLDYFEGVGGTANDDYKDDGVINDNVNRKDPIEGIEGPDDHDGKGPMEESCFGYVLDKGLTLSEDSVRIIAKNDKYFVSEDDISMLANFYGNRVSVNALLKKLSEHYDLPMKDLFVYSAKDHIITEAKKVAIMSNKAQKASMKSRVNAIDQQIEERNKKKKTSVKLKKEKEILNKAIKKK